MHLKSRLLWAGTYIGSSARRRRLKSRPALNGLDEKLAKYLSFRRGYFVEAGANDGYAQSNTYFLESSKGWTGLLVEGVPELATACKARRRRSTVVNCALVADTFAGDTVSMQYANLMSIVEGARGDRDSDQEHIELGLSVQHLEQSYTLDVPARTLSAILEELGSPSIDFLSLDVEGYELSVLQGLNLERHRPRFMLVEEWSHEEVGGYLCLAGYRLLEQLTYHDYFYVDARRDDVLRGR